MNTLHTHRRTAIVGGGAAGFFCAIQLGTMCPDMEITIFEQQQRVLRKVEISGGGRCNCTNTFADVTDLCQVYPRGAKLMKRLMKQFGPRDAFAWFERHGVPLTVQPDQCVFPKAQDSHAIIRCFLDEAQRLGVKLQVGQKVEDPRDLLATHDFVVVTTGGMLHTVRQDELWDEPLVRPVPSLFTFNIPDAALHQLMGIVVEHAVCSIPGTRFRAKGPLLLTHWGMSGPAILKLSSYAARHLAEADYQVLLSVGWAGENNADAVRAYFSDLLSNHSTKLTENLHPFGLNARLWAYLLDKVQLSGKRAGELGKKSINRLTELLTNDLYQISGRSPYKDEFVTCGGISLDAVHSQTLESRRTPHLFYAGEVLDIDGITGGFNFQAAWTTAYAVACGIGRYLQQNTGYSNE